MPSQLNVLNWPEIATSEPTLSDQVLIEIMDVLFAAIICVDNSDAAIEEAPMYLLNVELVAVSAPTAKHELDELKD